MGDFDAFTLGGHGSTAHVYDFANILHAWVDERDNTIRWREAVSGATSYRPARGQGAGTGRTTLRVVPNPSDASGAVCLQVGAGETVTRLTVVNLLTGASVAAEAAQLPALLASPAPDGATWVPLTALLPATASPGVYAVRLHTTRGAYATRFQLH